MPKTLRDRLRTETAQEFFRSAGERLADARVLEEHHRFLGATYLYGYVVEMTLKAAYFRSLGYPAGRQITVRDLRNATRSPAAAGIRFANFHAIDAWAELLIRFRSGSTSPLLPAEERRVRQHAKAVAKDWTPSIRYQRNVPYQYELARVRDAAVEIYGCRERLIP